MKHLVLGLISSLLLVSACADDLTAINATWATTSQGWQATVADAKKAGAELGASLGAIPAFAETDVDGVALKAKADAALAAHGAAVTAFEGAVATATTAVEAGQAEAKIASVQAAIDAGTASIATATTALTTAATDAAAAVAAVKARADEAAAAAAAAAAADPDAKDALAAKTANAIVDFPIAFDGNSVGADDAGFARFVKFMGTCGAVKVEISGAGPNAADGNARTIAFKKFAEANGVAGARINMGEGVVGENIVSAKVLTPCP